MPAKDPRRIYQIIALVKPFRAQAVLAALESIDILGGTVRVRPGAAGAPRPVRLNGS